MNSLELFRLSCITYENLIRKYTLIDSFTLSLTVNEKKCLDKFIEYCEQKFKGRVDFDFITSYTNYQFKYWVRLNTMRIKGYVPISWCFGKKAITRWESTDEFFKYSNRVKNEVSNKNEVIKQINKEDYSRMLTSLNQVEEVERARYLNKNTGFPWCVSNTSLYTNKSSSCIICNHSRECKEMLVLNIPHLAKLRGIQ